MKQNRPTYTQHEWQGHRIFKQLMTATCKAQHTALTWLSDDWLALLECDGKQAYVHGYTFPINTAASAAIMNDKVATYCVLDHAGIPAVPHFLIRPAAAAVTEQVLQLAPLPVVVKPNVDSSGGNNIYKCTTPGEFTAAVTELAGRYNGIAVSPFIEISAEYRVILLGNDPLLVYEKQRSDHWQHNLGLGAKPVVVPNGKLNDQLVTLARSALKATGGRVAAVDIVATPNGHQVIEINGGIMLAVFSQASPGYKATAQAIYAKLVTAALTPGL